MKLYLVRHGEATRFSGSDRLRELTQEGKRQARALGLYLKGFEPDLVLVSNYIRAKSTLDIILASSGIVGSPVISTGISPIVDPSELLIELKAYKKDQVLVVGHNPQLSSLVFEITGRDLNMLNCTLVIVDTESGELIDYKNVEEIYEI